MIRHWLAIGLTGLVVATGCSAEDAEIGTPDVSVDISIDPDGPDSTEANTSDTLPPSMEVLDGAPFPAARCEANRAAGTITYLSSFDFAASASIVDVLVADAKGYYDALCLDVEVVPSFATENYPLIAADEAQFASGGSFSEMVNFAGTNDVGFVALAVEGRTGIDALMIKPGAGIETLAELTGSTIGVEGAMTPSVKVMLAHAGLLEDSEYQTLQLEGHDPIAHMAVPSIVGFPVYKSDEPAQLEAAAMPFSIFDPADYDVAGSFGVVYTSAGFVTEYPTATEDFMRATMRGLADAIADPQEAAEIAIEAAEANGNPLEFTLAGELARWTVEAQLIDDGLTADAPLGIPVLDHLHDEVMGYAEIGLFNGIEPVIDTLVDPRVLASVYADGRLVWPAE